jgi:RNA polymerase sigma-70 factor (ECF subfamily)
LYYTCFERKHYRFERKLFFVFLQRLYKWDVLQGDRGGARIAQVVPVRQQALPSFETLYADCFAPVYRFVRVRVGDTAIAEDLTAEAFSRAWRAWPPRAAGELALRAWLFRIARNLVVDHYRQDGRKPVVPFDEDNDLSCDFDEEGRLNSVAMESAFRTLPERDQEALAARLAGCTNAEIAAVLGITEEGARKACLHALQRLAEKLEVDDVCRNR